MKRLGVGPRIMVVIGLVFTATILATVTSVIWPGQAKLLAPLFCDDARPDAFVVSDTYSDGTGETSTNFTLYCVGPRGQYRDVGWLKPFLGMVAAHAVVIVVLVWLPIANGRRKKRRRANAPTGVPGIISTSDVVS